MQQHWCKEENAEQVDIPVKNTLLISKVAVSATSGNKRAPADAFDACSSHRDATRGQEDCSDLKSSASHSASASFLSPFLRRDQQYRYRHMLRSIINCGGGRKTEHASAMRSSSALQRCRLWLIFPTLLLAVQLLQPCGAKMPENKENARPAHKLWSSALTAELRSKYGYPLPYLKVGLGATLRAVCLMHFIPLLSLSVSLFED